jgi:hypothetical protein
MLEGLWSARRTPGFECYWKLGLWCVFRRNFGHEKRRPAELWHDVCSAAENLPDSGTSGLDVARGEVLLLVIGVLVEEPSALGERDLAWEPGRLVAEILSMHGLWDRGLLRLGDVQRGTQFEYAAMRRDVAPARTGEDQARFLALGGEPDGGGEEGSRLGISARPAAGAGVRCRVAPAVAAAPRCACCICGSAPPCWRSQILCVS